MRSGSSPLAGRRLSCPREGRRPNSEDATFLVDAPFSPPSKKGICALCHSGPMLNMISQAHSDFAGGSPRPGVRFFNIGVASSINRTIRFERGSSTTESTRSVTLRSPDLGLLLHPNPPTPPPVCPPPRRHCGEFQDPDALGRQGHRTLLPQQRRQDAPRRRRSLSAVLQLHGGAGPGWFAVSGRFHRADRRRRRRHRRVPAASGSEPEG